jgi:NADPH2:quinone reductase
MRAIRVHEFGDPDVLVVEEVPQPEPVAGEVLVRIQAAGVNPYETYVRAGLYTELPALPYTPGEDGAGVRADTGERVYLTGSLSGTYAEYALCREEDVRALPDHLSYAQGAALGVPYLTAYRALLQRAVAVAGERVLIHGASGGVGIATVQLAVAAGLDITATAGSEAGSDLVAAQGDVRVVDHRDPAHLDAALALTGGRGFDVIIEFLANVNLGNDLKALAQRGRVVVVGSRGTVEVDARDLMNAEGTVLGMRTPNARPEELAAARAAVDAGLRSRVLRPVVGRELPLAEAPRAHRLIMERPALGRLVLVP